MAVAAQALTTRARLKAFLGLSADDAQTNEVLDRIIDSVTAWVESYTQRRFLRTTYTNEKYDGADAQDLLLRNYPIQTGETVALAVRNSSLDEDSWSTIPSAEFFIEPSTGILSFPKKKYGDRGREFAIGNQNYRVTYSAGFYLPQDGAWVEGAADSLPMDLEYVVWKLCGVAWTSRRGGDNVTSESIGQYSVAYSKEAFENENLTDILNKYERIDVTPGYR